MRLFSLLAKDFRRNKYIYFMLIPGLLYYIIYHYWPMYGALIAFKRYDPVFGMWGSPFVGFANFIDFFSSYYFMRILKNTLLISLYSLVWGFPAPIILALLLNEVKNTAFKRTIQTVTYLPHFISVMVICGLIIDFTSKSGLINDIIVFFGGQRDTLLLRKQYFRTIFISTGVWQELGWGSIIYLAALSGISDELYEAARIDGAGRFKQLIYITLPGLLPTIVILLIMRMGQVMNVGFEKIMLLYNPTIYETADVISTFVYRKGIIESNFSYSAAVGLFNSLINFTLLIASNAISRKLNETSLW